MADRKKQANKRNGATRNTASGSSMLKRLIIVALVGLFAAFLMYLDNMSTGDEQVSKAEKQAAKTTVQKNGNKKEKYKFDFYTELSAREVETYTIEEEPVKPKKIIVKKTAAFPAKKESVKKPPGKAHVLVEKPVAILQQQTNMLYQLQVGVFADWSKADAMKGRLALLGIEPNIQVFQVNGQKMYRVRIGPSTDAHKMERIKIQLKTQNINTFIQKIKL